MNTGWQRDGSGVGAGTGTGTGLETPIRTQDGNGGREWGRGGNWDGDGGGDP